ncbi:MAG: DUF1559 domain-containing protein [Zavarzinella sp.]
MRSNRDDDEYDYSEESRSRRERRRSREREEDYDDDRNDRRGRHPEPRKGNGLAVASFILGLISIIFGPLTGIVAAILGIMGYIKASNSKGLIGGQVLAITGTVLGVLFSALLILAVPFAIQKVRFAALNTRSANQCKQIGIGIHNYEAITGHLTGPYVTNQNTENTGLSWRVSLLPYIEQGRIHQCIDLSEAWDSPANRQFTSMYIPTYASLHDKTINNLTPHRCFVGENTLFDPSSKIGFSNVTDGLSNTLICVEATQTFPWAAPMDIPYKPGMILPDFGHQSNDKFVVAFADGSARIMKKTVSPQILHALITRNGGEPVRE